MKGIAVMLVNYFHDLSVAMLATNVCAVHFVGRILEGRPEHGEIIPRLFRALSKVTYGALAFVLVGGVFRASNFMEYEWNHAVGKGQVPALIVKHALLVALTLFGLITHRRYQEKYGRG